MNPHDELWIEIRPNDPSQGEHWMLRKITAQCDTGEVKIQDRFGENEEIIDLTRYSYHWVRPPGSVTRPTVNKKSLPLEQIPEHDHSDSEASEL